MRNFDCVQDAYNISLFDIKNNGRLVRSVTDPFSVGSLFGNKKRDFLELLGYSFILTNPRNRLIYSNYRKVSFGFNVANLIWLLSGRNDVATIGFYNKYGNAYSKNGVYYEAAFGDRIFGSTRLWDAAKELLKKDENSRRALMPIFIPSDLKTLPRDTPCASSIQVMIREKKIEFFLHMRSQSVATVFPYDIFLFTMLHEFMSNIIGIPMGNFYYYCNSFHYYMEESDLVSNILSEDRFNPKEMDEMCYTDGDVLNKVIKKEEEIRQAVQEGQAINEDCFVNIPSYWVDFLHIIYYKACVEHGIEPQSLKPKYLQNKHLYI